MDQLEIERRFLVQRQALPALPPGKMIVQVYLGFRPVVRIRLVEEKGFLSVKGRGLRTRREVEIEIPAEAARTLMELRTPGTCVVRKTRHRIPFEGYTWEVDFFESPFGDLALAEVELPKEKAALHLPPWVGREVTEDPAYQNANLARAKLPPQPG